MTLCDVYCDVPGISLCRSIGHVWSRVAKISEVKINLTQFIGGRFNHNIISTVIGSCTSGIETPFQLTTLNVMGASFDLFDVSMEIYNGKFTLGNVGHTH